MLGVRRAGVSEAASRLQKRGVIQYSQKAIRIVNSAALKEVACECFSVIREEYDRLLGKRPT
jgi:hypothetical protein